MKAAFITNSGPDIGGGHLSRCFALSMALEDLGVACRWILNDEAAPQAEALGIMDAAFFPRPFDCDISAALDGSDFAVADSYEPRDDFYGRVSQRVRLAAIDDLHDRGIERFASVVINYGVMARRDFYGSSDCKYLLGPRYALLRREYWDLEPDDGSYVLFVPGAADTAGGAASMASWWRGDMGELLIALGSLVPESRVKRTFAAASGKKSVKILVSPGNFAALMARAGRVICSASVTAYEALALEKKIAVFAAADNQRGLGAYLSGLGAAFDLGEWADANLELIRDALNFAPDPNALRGLVNKRGAAACAAEILNLLG